MYSEHKQQRLINSSERQSVESRLWGRAKHLSDLRTNLLTEQELMDAEIARMRAIKRISTDGQEGLVNKESKYRKLNLAIEEVKLMEAELQEIIEKLSEGNLSYEELGEVVAMESTGGEPTQSEMKATRVKEENHLRNRLIKRGIPPDDLWLFNL